MHLCRAERVRAWVGAPHILPAFVGPAVPAALPLLVRRPRHLTAARDVLRPQAVDVHIRVRPVAVSRDAARRGRLAPLRDLLGEVERRVERLLGVACSK